MIMKTLEMCSLHNGSFYGDALLSSWVFTWSIRIGWLAQ